MKKFKGLIIAFSLLLSIVAFTGCQSQNSGTTTDTVIDNVSKKNPITVDENKKSVTVYSEINGKYLMEKTRHGVVSESGSNGKMSLFKAYATPQELYDNLILIGAKPGNNMTADNKETTQVEGSPLKVTLSWMDNGTLKTATLDEAIKDSNGKPFDIRFGGNLETAKEKNTGCLLCLDSCPVGITSNHTYAYGAVEKRNEVAFTGNQNLLPEDGSPIAIIFTLNE